jgi:hypothetical protein
MLAAWRGSAGLITEQFVIYIYIYTLHSLFAAIAGQQCAAAEQQLGLINCWSAIFLSRGVIAGQQ